MTNEQTTDANPVDSADIETGLVDYLEMRTKTSLSPEQDLFASGLVSSMFAMELVVYLETTYGVAVAGPDLKLENFRTVRQMTELVHRLSGDPAVAGGA